MGGFFSTTSVSNSNSNSALIISSTGELRPYSTPVFVSDVLQTESEAEGRKSSGSKITPFVIGVIVDEEAQIKHDKQSALRVSRSGSIRRKMQYGRRTRLSFRLRLSTIYETDQSSHSHKHYS
ncbi:hypothetical protein E3N88_11749 [Mikania micrantha]|uniref:Uncharacterized protein n=1 Tax=Mikania micrantha TaxID=192012 RepID=A0A5N6P3L0_9ASTR|nr:hypothetical protein E3N88_11749 [Mikania micrantha]